MSSVAIDRLIKEEVATHRTHNQWVGFSGADPRDVARQINGWLLDHSGWYVGKIEYSTALNADGLMCSTLIEMRSEPK